MKIDEVTKLNLHKCLYALAFMKEKAELERRRIKKNFK
tara:strand:+ start:1499 stop:1612 length:114 start_codon:yes stop_codon:yes gene_type:complete